MQLPQFYQKICQFQKNQKKALKIGTDFNTKLRKWPSIILGNDFECGQLLNKSSDNDPQMKSFPSKWLENDPKLTQKLDHLYQTVRRDEIRRSLKGRFRKNECPLAPGKEVDRLL